MKKNLDITNPRFNERICPATSLNRDSTVLQILENMRSPDVMEKSCYQFTLCQKKKPKSLIGHER